MKISELFTKLEKSKIYKDFKKDKETKSAFFCAGFFILNLKNNIFEYSFDFRNDKNIFTFKVPQKEGEITLLKEELIPSRKPLEKIDDKDFKFKADIDDIQKIIQKELDKSKVTNPLDEIIAVLQDYEGNLIWNLTCMCEGFTIINSHIDPRSGKVLKFEKKNLMDFISVKKVDKK